MSDFPVLDAFHAFNPKNIPIQPTTDYGLVSAVKVFKFYGNNKIDIYEGKRKQASKLIKASEEYFLGESSNYFKFIAKKLQQSRKRLYDRRSMLTCR